MGDGLQEEAVKYFKAHQVLFRLVRDFSQKYRSLGHFGGSVSLSSLSDTEQRDLGAFLRREIKGQTRVSFRELSNAWNKTRFEGIDIENFILSLLPDNFVSKQEERRQKENKRQLILDQLLREHSSELATKWLQSLKDGQLRLSKRDLNYNMELLNDVATGLDHIVDVYERLPVFANRATGNPHAFDFDQPAGRLLLQAMAFLRGSNVPMAADERTSLLYQYHVIRDDILNFATVYGLVAYRKTGAEIAYWRESTKSFSPLNIPLREIIQAHKIEPIGGIDMPVYIVENSGIFSALMDTLIAIGKVLPLIAFHGQLKAASWAVLDRLGKSGAKILYAGDLDPEGIGIAQHILSRYDNVDLWHMSVDDYKEAVTDLPDGRLQKLPSSVHPKLTDLVQEMKMRKKALYQESLLDKMVYDIERL
ncbi:TIGR02679 family protein [uncultured Anaerovibrio sp.]|uniref:TIGR02679 family protein n=1 Tax=uncultured Anaerovibrio sp. TaxID=361586 RepID=UPI0025FDCD98|nr:TIGR02679 family protein [uncultured Anaerovibrio sp.]